jgi:hypothetical protein
LTCITLLYILQDDDDIYGNNTDILSNEWLNENCNILSQNVNSNDDNSNKNLSNEHGSKNSSEKNSNENSNDEDFYEILSDNSSEILSNASEDYEIQNSIIIDVRSAQKVQKTDNSTSSFPNPAYESFCTVNYQT